VNGSFEIADPGRHQVEGWYHQRQLTVQREGRFRRAPVRHFQNSVEAGRPCGQAFAVDGLRIKALTLSGMVKGENIRPGSGPHAIATVVIACYDRDRQLISQQPIGDWRESFGWVPFAGRVDVPVATKEAILQIGLHGATGGLSFDALKLGAIPVRGHPDHRVAMPGRSVLHCETRELRKKLGPDPS